MRCRKHNEEVAHLACAPLSEYTHRIKVIDRDRLARLLLSLPQRAANHAADRWSLCQFGNGTVNLVSHTIRSSYRAWMLDVSVECSFRIGTVLMVAVMFRVCAMPVLVLPGSGHTK